MARLYIISSKGKMKFMILETLTAIRISYKQNILLEFLVNDKKASIFLYNVHGVTKVDDSTD